jgi:hypothetical protein
VKLEVFTAMNIEVAASWVMTPYSDVVGNQRFGGPCCFHFFQPVPPKCYLTTSLHSVETQKTPF